MATNNPSQDKPQFAKALQFLRPAWKAAVGAVLLALFTAGMSSVEPMVQKELIDALAPKAEVIVKAIGQVANPAAVAHIDIGSVVFHVIGIMALLALLRGAFTWFSGVLTWRLKLLSNRDMYDKAARTIYNQSLSFHSSARTGAIMSNLERGVNGFSSELSEIMISLLPNALSVVCTFFFMVYMDPRLTIIAFAFAPIPAGISVISGRLKAAREKKVVRKWADIFARFHETLILAKTVKSFNLSRSEHDRFMVSVDDTHSFMTKGIMLDSTMIFFKNRMMDAARLTVLGYGAYLVAGGDITIGTLVAFLSFTQSLFAPMLGLMGAYETISKAQAYCEIVYEIIDEPQAVADRPDAKCIQHADGRVEFDQVSFGYLPERPVFKNMSFTVDPGSMIALVGGSGSGKTTIVDLLNRFYDPNAGRILLDGVDLRDVKQESLRRQIGMVLQDTALFNDTIRNNIAAGRPGATDEEIEAAARAAAADMFIIRKPDRYDTVVGERGTNLSAGERQRVAIARAILKDPQIFVFDEASSNLDAESEELISNVIEDLAKTKTVFVIAHRLISVRHANRILVLGEGRICEDGTHEELVALKGQYYKLLTTQAPEVPCPPCEEHHASESDKDTEIAKAVDAEVGALTTAETPAAV